MSRLDVLLVEDNPLNSELVRDLLELEGHRVRLVTSAAAFRLALGGEGYDLVLMDIGLPDGDGVDLLHELRAAPHGRRGAVIALTAHALSGDAERFIAAGFDAVLTKPIDTRSFVGELIHVAARRAAKER